MKKVLLFILLMCISLFSQTKKPNKVLIQSYIDSFVKNYDLIEKDIKSVEMGYKEKNIFNDENLYFIASRILKKYGIGNEPVEVYAAIKYGYSAVVMKDNISAITTPSTKTQYENLLKTYQTMVHPDDLAIVERNKILLDKIFNK